MPDRKTQRTTIFASAAVAAATNSDKVAVQDFTEALVFLDCTAVSGTSPTMDPVVQVSDDDGTTWYTISKTMTQEDGATLTQITAIGQYVFSVTNIGKHLRVRFPAPGGSSTPTLTFAVIVEAKN